MNSGPVVAMQGRLVTEDRINQLRRHLENAKAESDA